MCSIKWWLAAYLSTLVHIASSNPVVPNNLHISNTPSKTANLSAAVKKLGYLPVPSGFEVHPLLFPTQIEYEPEAVLTNIIQAMEETAMGDFRGYMPLWRFWTATYPQPVITLSTPLKTEIKREYVIWGLLLATISIMSQETYEMMRFALVWHREVVGSITIGDFHLTLDPAGHSSASNESLSQNAHRNASRVPNAITARAPNSTVSAVNETQARVLPSISDDRLHVEFRSSGDDVGIENLLPYMLVVLAQIASPPSDTEITHRWKGTTSFGGVCRFVLIPTARQEPPFMMFFWLIEAVARAARYVIEHDAYRNLNMLIYADGRLIGNSAFVCILPNTIDSH